MLCIPRCLNSIERKQFVKTLKTLAAAAALVALSGAAQAALINRGGGMIYDTTRNITWLADWNYAKTSSYDSDGAMNTAAAQQWASTLQFAGYADWRLPSGLNSDGSGPCLSYQCVDSEFGYMFYTNWGAVPYKPFSDGTNKDNIGLFFNVGDVYWTGTALEFPEFIGSPDGVPFVPVIFVTNGTISGFQGTDDQTRELFAVAVRDGDVAAAVPEPQTLSLALLALGATVVARRGRPV